MQLTPRYEGEPIITLEGSATSIRAPFLRQRRRFAAALTTLDAEQWAAQSRCDAWSSQDVVTHLVSTDPFWAASLQAGIAGSPTNILLGFDPNATPAALVDGTDDADPAGTLATFTAATTDLCALVESLDDDAFAAVAEAPPGHVSVTAMLHHALWDCWVHERDVLVPLGMTPEPEADEVLHCLRYGAALTAAFAVLHGPESRTGSLTVDVEDPDDRFHLVIDDAVIVADGAGPDDGARLSGSALDVLEGLSVRRPLDHDLGDDAWMLAGLRTVFDSAGTD